MNSHEPLWVVEMRSYLSHSFVGRVVKTPGPVYYKRLILYTQ